MEIKQDISINFSVRDIKEFELDRVWMLIVSILKDRLELKRNELEQANDMNTVCDIQGHILELRHIISLPDILKESIEFEKDNNSEDETENLIKGE